VNLRPDLALGRSVALRSRLEGPAPPMRDVNQMRSSASAWKNTGQAVLYKPLTLLVSAGRQPSADSCIGPMPRASVPMTLLWLSGDRWLDHQLLGAQLIGPMVHGSAVGWKYLHSVPTFSAAGWKKLPQWAGIRPAAEWKRLRSSSEQRSAAGWQCAAVGWKMSRSWLERMLWYLLYSQLLTMRLRF
jgi:hypothetical protein